MKTPITTLLKSLSIAALISSASFVWADLAGNVVRVNGNATAKDADGKSRPLSAGSVINEGDVVSTATGAAIQLQMKDGALLALTSDSSLRIQMYNFEEANGEADNIQLKLEKGRFRTITGDVPKTSYNLATPAAMVKIKGTTYDVLVENEGTTTILRDGAVTVETVCDGKGTGNVQLLDIPGDAIAISAPCKEPESKETEEDVTDLEAILPEEEEDDTRCVGSQCNQHTPSGPASP